MSIQILPPQLANQIAAGEVVERPSSVVKELVENSLDAGASHIEIDIEKGGSKLIRVRDNGSGIAEHELVLALSRHATSKIHQLSDLEQISSLGFRGEALASISSVSRLTLTSCTAEQSAAWQASAEGRDMQVQVKPAAHPQGTSVEVVDLFFNTPARRRFLRSDKTEFMHIDELVKRLALSRYDVSWQLNHNGQSIRRLKAALTEQQRQQRVAILCGKRFADKAVYIENQYDNVRLWGWLLAPEACPAQLLCQYTYVNGRMMKDKVLNHAIRQAYGERLTAEQQPAFVLYLEIDPFQVDVNVHPAKHEVRFHQARLIHDFVVSALSDALQQLDNPPQPLTETAGLQVTEPAEPAYIASPSSARSLAGSHTADKFSRPAVADVRQHLSWLETTKPAAKITTESADIAITAPVSAQQTAYLIAENRYLLLQHADAEAIQVVDLTLSVGRYWQSEGTESAALLLPLRLNLAETEKKALLNTAEIIAGLGFDLLIKEQTAIVRAVPVWLRDTTLSRWLPQWFALLSASEADNVAETLLELLLGNKILPATTLIPHFKPLLSEPSLLQAIPLQLTATLAQFQDKKHD